MENDKREIVYRYIGSNIEADKAQFWSAVQRIETRHLPYFISRPGIFEDDAYERLTDHFFFVVDSSLVVLVQAESSTLPPEIVNEVQGAFKQMFDTDSMA